MTDLPRVSTSYYAKDMAIAREVLGLPANATLDQILKCVIQGTAAKPITLEAWLAMGKTFINQPTKDTP
jgi:hypothetical protein